jgi:uncharacterized protein with GYD domain
LIGLLGFIYRFRTGSDRINLAPRWGAIQVPINEKGDDMPIYVVLGNFTQKRMETIKKLPEGIKDSTEVFKSHGAKLKELVFTMGRYDVVAIFEAPNEEAITKALLSWGSQGLLRTETLTGFTPEKMIELVQAI